MMKQSKLSILFLLGMFLFIQPAKAMVESTITNNSVVVEKQKKELKKELKSKKRMAKLEKLFQKAGIDINDPVKKWLWFALGFGVASIFLSIFFGGWLAGVAWSAAGICLLIWLLKYLNIV